MLFAFLYLTDFYEYYVLYFHSCSFKIDFIVFVAECLSIIGCIIHSLSVPFFDHRQECFTEHSGTNIWDSTIKPYQIIK